MGRAHAWGLALVVAASGCLATACGSGTAHPTSRPSTPVIASSASEPPTYTTNPALKDKYRAKPTQLTVHLDVVPMPAPGLGDTAEQCWPATKSDVYVVGLLAPDTPSPRCINLTGTQRIALTNATDRFGTPGYAITVRLGSYKPVTIKPEETVYFADPVTAYFTPGAHRIEATGSGGPEIYVRDATHREGCQPLAGVGKC